MPTLEDRLRQIELNTRKLQRDMDLVRRIGYGEATTSEGGGTYVPVSRTIFTSGGLTGGASLRNDVSLSVNRGSGLNIDGAGKLILDSAVFGEGLQWNAETFTVSVGEGAGILVSGSTVSLNSTLAGLGLSWDSTNNRVNVQQGPGIIVSTENDNVAVSNGDGIKFDDDDRVTIDYANGLTLSGGKLVVSQGTLISVTSGGVNLASGTAQYQIPVTGVSPSFTPSYQLLSSYAGAGLGFTSNFFVGKGNGIVVGDDTVSLGAPSSLSFNSTNSVTTNSHTHQIVNNSVVTSETGETILSSNSFGYLQLVRLGLGKAPTFTLDVNGNANVDGQIIGNSGLFDGSVTIQSNGDFSVFRTGQSQPVFYVLTAGSRVGINRPPDQQFDLDVAGAIRGQYLIGKHAIQLESAIGVFHYDGAAPYRLDNTGSNNSHMGVGGTELGAVIYRPGKYGKAVQITEVTTNLVSNPSFETGTTGWDNYSTGTATGTRTRVQGDLAYYGDWAYEIVKTGGGATDYYGTYIGFNVEAGKTYTYSAWVRIANYVGGTGTIFLFGSGGIPATTKSFSGSTEWERISFTATATTNAYSGLFIMVANAETMTLYIDGVQVEEKAYATPYCDGSLGAGHSWSGTAHASTSTRTGATLRYDNRADMNLNEGSIMMWVQVDGLRSGGNQLWGANPSGGTTPPDTDNAEFDAFLSSTGGITFRQNDINLSFAAGITAGTWNHLAFTWSYNENTRKIFLNGVEVASRQFDSGAIVGDNLFVGQTGVGGSNFSVNGLIDEFVLLEYPADPKLIRAIYESDAPVFVESSVFHWRSPAKVPIWVDEFGMWARGVNGGEILGLYGGDPRHPLDNVTKSWGGIAMEENDIVIGRVAGAVVHWDDSVGSLIIGRPAESNVLLSNGLAQMRDGTTVYGFWDNNGIVIGQNANGRSRLYIDNNGNLNIINKSSTGVDTTRISLNNSGNATFTGQITSTSGLIGGWSIGATALTAGNTDETSVGLSTGDNTNGVAFFAGDLTPNDAPFKVTRSGTLTATDAVIIGNITATTGLISGTLTIGQNGKLTFASGNGTLDNTGIYLVPAGSESNDRSYLFRSSSNTVQGGLYSFFLSGGISNMTLKVLPNGLNQTQLFLESQAGTTTLTTSRLQFYTEGASDPDPEVAAAVARSRSKAVFSMNGTEVFVVRPNAAEVTGDFSLSRGTATSLTRVLEVVGASIGSSTTDYARLDLRNYDDNGSGTKDGAIARISARNANNDRSSALYFSTANSGTDPIVAMSISPLQVVTIHDDLVLSGDITSNVTISKGTPQLILTPTGISFAQIDLQSNDNGSSIGSRIMLGRNSNASTPAAGYIRVTNRGNTVYRIWPDADGNLRIWDGGDPTSANDKHINSVIIGTQTSHEKFKTITGDATPIDEVMERLQAATQHVAKFIYTAHVEPEVFEGLVIKDDATETHHYGTDKRGGLVPSGTSLNLINLCADLMRAVVYLNERVEALQ